MDTPPHPTDAIRETPSATYRKGQWSILAKVLTALQVVIVPTLGYLVVSWKADQDEKREMKQQLAILEVKFDQQDRGFGELKAYMQRVEEKLDRILMERRQ